MTQPNIPPIETQEISLRLESYDDIFSDFDIRPYSKRALSTDFLDEIRRASRDKADGGIELALHVPHNKRNTADEEIIIERLAAHFKHHFQITHDEKKSILRRGIWMIFAGTLFTIAATLLVYKNPTDDIFMSFLVVFLEPAAWFSLWEGMNEIVFGSRTVKPELDFYKKMSHSQGHVHFKSY